MTTLSGAQISVLADQLAPRIDAVLDSFGLRRAGEVRCQVHEDPARFNDVLALSIPFRRREAVR